MRPRTTLLAATFLAQARAESILWYWATTVVTETVWMICGAEETASETVGSPSKLPGCLAHRAQMHEKCPSSTSIVLANAVLTGITIQPASSPTSCYRLPIPASSLEVIAFAANGISSTDDPDPVFFYVGENATAPEHVSTVIDGKRCFLDISSNASAAGRMALTIARGESLLFDETGMHLFNADCDTVSSVAIRSFLDQLVSIAHEPLPLKMKHSAEVSAQRSSSSNFTVAIQVDDIVGGQLVEPYRAFGPSPCTFISRQHSGHWDNLTWNCEYPGANSAVRSCENSFQTWLEPSSRTLTSDKGNNGTVTSGDKLFNYIPAFLNHGRDPIARMMPGLSQPLLDGMSWVSSAQAAVLDVAQAGGGALRGILHFSDQYEILFSDPGLPSPHTIGVYRSPPVPTIIGTVASRTTRMTKMPTRQVNPTVTSFSSVTATAFPVLPLGALTGGLGSAPDAAEGPRFRLRQPGPLMQTLYEQPRRVHLLKSLLHHWPCLRSQVYFFVTGVPGSLGRRSMIMFLSLLSMLRGSAYFGDFGHIASH